MAAQLPSRTTPAEAAAPVAVGRLLEVGVAVSNLADARARLVELLGGPTSHVLSEPTFLMRFQMCRTGGADFELMQGDAGSMIERYVTRGGEGLHHIAFQVADADAALAAFRRRGVPVLSEEPVRFDNLKAFFLRPDCLGGVLVECVENLHGWIEGEPLPALSCAPHEVDVGGLGIEVRDLEGAASSFGDLLGADIGPIRSDSGRCFRARTARVANVELNLVERPGSKRALHHVLLRVASMDRTVARLERAGVGWLDAPAEWRLQEPSVFTDPDSFHGVAFQLVQWKSEPTPLVARQAPGRQIY